MIRLGYMKWLCSNIYFKHDGATVIDCFLKLHISKCIYFKVRFGSGFSTKIKTAYIERIRATVVTVKMVRFLLETY